VYTMAMYIISSLSTFVVLLVTTEAFLFPDLKQRSGNGGTSFKIAVIQEEPYLYTNGSGQVIPLLDQISKAYSIQHGGAELALDVIPVRTWTQLMSKAKSSRRVGFGLIIPSLTHSQSWSGRHLGFSVPAFHTSAKVVVKRIGADNMRSHSNEAIVLRGSPLEHLLINVDAYPGPVRTADTLDIAVEMLRAADGNTVLLTDAATADSVAQKVSDEFRSVCPKEIAGSQSMYYGFFGTDAVLLGHLNDALLALTPAEETTGFNPLQCPH